MPLCTILVYVARERGVMQAIYAFLFSLSMLDQVRLLIV